MHICKIIVISLFLISFIGCSITIKKDTNWTKGEYSQLPGIVSLTTGWGRSHLCTAVLIKPNVALTAAHCLYLPPKDMYITYGCNTIGRSNCSIVKVKERFTAPKYRHDKILSNDLGVVITESPIDLPYANLYASDYTNKDVIQGGMGRRLNRSGILYNNLTTIRRNKTFEFVTGNSYDIDPHGGDSGGPGYIEENGELKVAGILSRGVVINKRVSGLAIYTKPFKYIEWVESVIK